MKPIPILIISPDRKLLDYLRQHLPDSEFECRLAAPGNSFLEKAEGIRIAIVDRIDRRPLEAPEEIARLKEFCRSLPVIAISEHSTERDAAVVRQGLFYYMSGPPGRPLIRVIRAAADAWEAAGNGPSYSESKTKETP